MGYLAAAMNRHRHLLRQESVQPHTLESVAICGDNFFIAFVMIQHELKLYAGAKIAQESAYLILSSARVLMSLL